ncbi:polymer-forming cytoskeletal protein [Treponema sp. OMZ 840]|uniref:bactofilin family protein n=1 Tax=Treponema sp. OMZ 840 TaxID=244313 RepID=UPI003D932A34
MPISYRQKEGDLTILGAETELNGVLSFSGNLVITGKFIGSIESTGSLVIEKNGVCTVNGIKADSISIAGQVEGNMYAKTKLEMFSGSKIVGNVETSRLRIADNVNFHGEVKMLDEVPDMDIFSVSAAEYKKMVSERTFAEEEEDV